MLPILTADQIRNWDSFTIRKEPISSLDLMERASNAFVNWFITKFNTSQSITVICGSGNNGGDGLAIARILSNKKHNVTVYILIGSSQSVDFKTNLDRLPGNILTHQIAETKNVDLDSFEILIDALFGSGLSRPIEGVGAELIKTINESTAVKVAVDAPSGLRIDETSTGSIVKADYTIAFQVPKLAFMLPQNAEYVGEWHIADIGLHNDFLKEENAVAKHFFIDDFSVRKIIQPRKKFSHKGDYGRALLVAGSFGKMGACILSARAALRSGSGLLTVHVPKCGYQIIQTAVPEAMTTVDKNENYFSDPGELKSFDVIGVGPGLGNTPETVNGLRKLMESGKPMVLDADALNIISQNRGLLHLIPPGSILTPHPGEFARLVGEWKNDFDRLTLQKNLAAQIKSVVVLKGPHTSVSTPDGHIYFNSTGNPGMAKGGSGDVLTGILTALLSQKYPAYQAAIAGVYLHGLAADFAADKIGEHSLIATDIVEFLGQAFSH